MSNKSDYLNSFFSSTCEKTLSSKTIELDHLKAEWTAKMNDLAAKHKHEMATEKEKAIQVKYIISRVHVEKKIKYIQALKMFELTCIFSPFDFQMQSSYQQRQERERKDMEQAHMKIVKQMESRLYEMEGVNKVLCRFGCESSINENVFP